MTQAKYPACSFLDRYFNVAVTAMQLYRKEKSNRNQMSSSSCHCESLLMSYYFLFFKSLLDILCYVHCSFWHKLIHEKWWGMEVPNPSNITSFQTSVFIFLDEEAYGVLHKQSGFDILYHSFLFLIFTHNFIDFFHTSA